MKTVQKALDILEVFLNGQKEVGVAELAKTTGYNLSTIYSILLELSRRGYITQQKKRGKYSLGFKFYSFSDALSNILAIEEVFHPFMQELSQKVNETVNIAIRDGNHPVTIKMIQCSQRLQVVTDKLSGDIRMPLFCTGTGRILLAGMTNEEIAEYFQRSEFNAYTPNTTIDKKKLLEVIQKVRSEDWAEDFEECEVGICNVAAPIRNYTGKVVMAIGIVGPSARLSRQKVKEIAPAVKETAMKLSEILGYRRDSENHSSADNLYF